MLIYSYGLITKFGRGCFYEFWHPADQERLYAARLTPSEQITALSFWLGADADSISDASLHEVPKILASDHFMWGGADMETV
jgi:hypothetical protein